MLCLVVVVEFTKEVLKHPRVYRMPTNTTTFFITQSLKPFKSLKTICEGVYS